jgi:hypothetical protein
MKAVPMLELVDEDRYLSASEFNRPVQTACQDPADSVTPAANPPATKKKVPKKQTGVGEPEAAGRGGQAGSAGAGVGKPKAKGGGKSKNALVSRNSISPNIY